LQDRLLGVELPSLLTLQTADSGDTTTIEETLEEAAETLAEVLEDEEAAAQLSETVLAEVVADKGYHSNAVLTKHAKLGIRTYVSEPDRGRRRWRDKEAEKAATYGNRRRIRGARGKRLLRSRGELVERSFAHAYETGAMRRTHLRHHTNIRKRQLVHLAGFNLSLILRKLCGIGKPRALQGAGAALLDLLWHAWAALEAFRSRLWGFLVWLRPSAHPLRTTNVRSPWPTAVA